MCLRNEINLIRTKFYAEYKIEPRVNYKFPDNLGFENL